MINHPVVYLRLSYEKATYTWLKTNIAHEVSPILYTCSISAFEKRLKDKEVFFAYKHKDGGILQDIIQEYVKQYNYPMQRGYYVKKLNLDKQVAEKQREEYSQLNNPNMWYLFTEENDTNDVEVIQEYLSEPILFIDDGIDEIFGNAYNDIQDLIEFDNCSRNATRKLLYNDIPTKSDTKIYNPFFDKDLLQYYFSIPLTIRYEYRLDNELLFFQ